MKKNITVNLFGALYAIDEDACKLLDDYLENMKSYFSKRDGGDEIADDIEHRVAELFAELKEQGVEAISIEQVQQIIHRIGNPEEMDDEAEATPSSEDAAKRAEGESDPKTRTTPPPPPPNPEQKADHKAEKTSWFAKRKLYRDPQDQMLGGVMSGLCWYFGGSDPLPWRILMVLLAFFSFSTMGIIYLVAWAIIPAAVTAEERLQMKGHPVNPQTLNEELMNGVGKAGDYIASPKFQSQAKGCFSTFLTVILFCIKLFILFAIAMTTLALLIFGGALTVGTLGSASHLIGSGMIDKDFIEVLNISPNLGWQLWTIAISGLIFCGIILYSVIRSMIKRPTDKPMGAGTKATLSIIAILSFATAATFMVLDIAQIDHTRGLIEIKENTINGNYIKKWNRELLVEHDWNIIQLKGLNKNESIINHANNLTDENGESHIYYRFKKEDGAFPMRVQLERNAYYPPGNYHLEVMGYTKAPGVYTYVKNDSSLITKGEIQPDNDNDEGNMAQMTMEQFNRTQLPGSPVGPDTWEQYTKKQIKGWSYFRSASFTHPGGMLTVGFTNQPKAVGLAGTPSMTRKFAIRRIRIVADSMQVATTNPAIQ